MCYQLVTMVTILSKQLICILVNYKGLFFVALTTSSFYPLVEDPYFQVIFKVIFDCHGNVQSIGEDSLC